VPGIGHIEATDAVADEVRRILADHDAFAQRLFTEFNHEIDNFFIRFHTGNDFHQLHVAGRIEEVGPEETFLQSRTEFRADVLDGNTGSVRRNDTGRFNNFFHLGEKFLFDFEVFNDNFANPVDVGQPLQIVFKVADLDHGRVLLGVETGGFGFRHTGQAVRRKAIPPGGAFFRQTLLLVGVRQFEWNDIEKVTLDTGIGQMSRDGRAHDTRS